VALMFAGTLQLMIPFTSLAGCFETALRNFLIWVYLYEE